MPQRTALGKGIGALIPSLGQENVDKNSEIGKIAGKLSTISSPDVEKEVDTAEKVVEIPLSKVEPRPGQPRMVFDENALQELAESVRQHGVLQPILVTETGDHYEIIAGERRWRAAKLAGLKKIPAIVRSFSQQSISEIALIENLQREDLNPIEEATAYRQLIKQFGMKQEELADRVAKSRTAVTNRLRLLKLEERVQAMVMNGELSEGHARTLLGLEDRKLQFEAAGRVVKEHLSVRETERLVKHLNEPPKAPAKDWPEEDKTVYDDLEQKLRRSLGTRVNIRRTQKDKGQIVIDYGSVEEFERLFDILKG